jgi:hypothetical protein
MGWIADIQSNGRQPDRQLRTNNFGSHGAIGGDGRLLGSATSKSEDCGLPSHAAFFGICEQHYKSTAQSQVAFSELRKH